MLPLFFFLLLVFFSLHKIAADLAIEATSIFLSDIRSTVGDDIFAKFLNLKSENSMALVIDVSGSMSGELKIMIPFLCLLVGYLGKPVGLGLDCKTVWLFELTMTPVIRQKCPKASGGSGGEGGGNRPLNFRPNEGPKGQKKFLETTPQATSSVRLEAFTTNRSEIGGQKNYNPTVSSL